MPRILCLPGFLQSGSLLAEKSSGLRKLLTKKLNYDLVYLDPPVIISTKDQLPFKLSVDPQEENERWADIVAKDVNRCWWLKSSSNDYVGFEDAMKYIVKHLEENGPYDGIIGFSQGAAMSAIVANSIEKLVPKNGPLGIAVLFSPFAFTVPKNTNEEMAQLNSEITDLKEYTSRVDLNPLYKTYFEPQSSPSTKMVAVYGTEDAVVPPVRTEYLCSLYPEIEIVKHDGGHYMPNKKSFLNPIVELFKGSLEGKPEL
ncbi:hypothetical protein JCM33374_g6143 [Metschnikowia sp. JCM 33374]|nr:hypothetical protein JCM33374_g6143 [Metschnikowia sp. JCM 33374]